MPPHPTPSTVELGPIPAAAGIGLRFPHHRFVDQSRPNVAWFEIHSENYMGGGSPLDYLDSIRGDYPISCHGVGLSLGSASGLDDEHLERLRALIDRVEPGLVSEHLSWSIADGTYLADLLPLPLTEESLEVVCTNVDRTQSFLGRRILIENPSSYLRYKHSVIPEGMFLAAVAERTGCGILCDVNNVYVSAHNHGWDAVEYLCQLPRAAVAEIHLAGHAIRRLENGFTLRIDDHGSRVAPAVWSLFDEALSLFGPQPTLIEWDTDIPDFSTLVDESVNADRHLRSFRGQVTHANVA